MAVPNDNNGTLGVPSWCNGANFRQYWQVVYTGTESEWFRIQNRTSLRCLVVQGPNVGAQGKQTTCVPGYDDQWW